MSHMQAVIQDITRRVDELIDRVPESFPEYKDALHFNPTKFTAEEWQDVPETVVEFIVHLQHHHQTVVDHLENTHKLETVANVRIALEERINVSNC